MRPQSSTATMRSSSTRPVSESISTTATCAPNGYEESPWLKSSSCARWPSQPAGRLLGFHRRRSRAPATRSCWPERLPHRARRRAITMSSTFASSRCAASCFACSSTSIARVVHRAARDLQRARTHRCPSRAGTTAVSDWMSRTFSIGMPSNSLTIIANAVRVTLPVRRRADGDVDAAVGRDLDLAVLLEEAGRGDLDVRRHADTEQLAVAAFATSRLLRAQLFVAGNATRFVERLRVLAAVVVRPGDSRERERVGRDEVALADLDRVDAELSARRRRGRAR